MELKLTKGKSKSKRVDNIDMLVAQNIKKIRLEKGHTIASTSEFLGISPQQHSKYEQGINRVSASVLFRLSKYLKTELNVFFKQYIKDTHEK